MRRWLMVFMLAALSIGGMAEARAQEDAFPATPLSQLGLPELHITTADSAISVPNELDAGRYFLTVENVSDAGSIAIEFYRAPDGMAAIDLVPEFTDSAEESQAPEGFYDALMTGGVVANAGSTGEAVIDLPAGSWLVLGYIFGDEQDGFVWQVIEITGDIGNPEDPDSDVDVNLEDFAFDFSVGPRAGNLVWEIENDGAQPHFITIYSYPGELTEESVNAAIFEAYEEAPLPVDPAVTPIDFDQLAVVGGSGTMSPNTEAWLQLDLPPGTYLALCQVADRDSGLPHSALGQFAVFTVS